jgi:putative two-component system response regulator
LSDPRARILVVDDEAPVRELLHSQLSFLDYDCTIAASADEALRLVAAAPPALVLSDVEMPGGSGLDLLRRLKERAKLLPVVMVSGVQDLDVVRQSIQEGAYDYLVKPFQLEDLANTVRRAIEHARLVRQNQEYGLNLERMVREQTEEIAQTRDIALLTLAKLAESRDNETGLHLERMAAYSRLLAEALRAGPYAPQVAGDFIEHLFKSSPLHDIGKVGIPDSILLKPGPLTAEEFAVMRTHAANGGDTLRAVLRHYSQRTFLDMAMEICYHHHERWDGKGYPHGLAGDAIPLPARIVAVADAYDAITSDRPYKRAFDHAEAVRRITVDRDRHFDSVLVDAFLACAAEFPRIQARFKDPRAAGEPAASAAASPVVR